ncbi:MAG: CBS domain-containing protein [Acidimicrobiia bacterium]|nr:CBS domain-containing protein [Acidimicrobiia bacterium]
MTDQVETFSNTCTVGDARARFAAGRHGAYPIVDGSRLVGIVTRGDILRDDSDDDAPLSDHAAREVVTVAPDDTAQTALRVMVDEQVEHVPVIGHGELLVGICTRTDLLKVRRRQMDLEKRQDGLAARLSSGPRRFGRRRLFGSSPGR